MTNELSTTQVRNNGQLTHAELKNVNFQNVGFRDAGKVMGAVEAFKVSLERFYSRLMVKAAKNEDRRKEERHSVQNSIASLERETEIKAEQIEGIKTGKLTEISAEISAAKDEIRDVKQHPEKYVNRERDAFRYYMYMAVLICLGLFLVIFYSSVVYSAFFRHITIDKDTIYNSVFYTNVFSEASRSFEMFMMVLLGPVVFIGLGIIMHLQLKKWSEPGIKNKLSVISVLVLTFLFDSLLAYHIAKKLHDANAMNSFDRIPEFTVGDAMVDANFWLVIFFGFIVYLIFGKILSLFEGERNSKLVLERLLKGKEDKLNELLSREAGYKDEIRKLEDEINALKLEIARLNEPAEKIFFNPHELKKILSEYTLGWMQYLKQGMYKEQDLAIMNSSLESFYSEKGIK